MAQLFLYDCKALFSSKYFITWEVYFPKSILLGDLFHGKYDINVFAAQINFLENSFKFQNTIMPIK